MRTENMGYRADPSAIKESADWTESYRNDMRRTINDNPSGAVLSALGAGFGIGLAIGLSIAMSGERRTPMQRRTDRLRYRADGLRDHAEELGHRVMESLHDYLPDSLARRM